MVTQHRAEHPAQVALRRIVADVATVIPRELKGKRYWQMTVREHEAFIDAVRACETNDCAETRNAVRRTGAAWKDAWVRASRAWVEEQKRARSA